MFGMGGTEILVILIVALLFLGPDKLPEAAKQISKGIRDIKKQSRVLQRTIEDDEHIGGAIRDLKSALRGEDEPIRPPVRALNELPVAAATVALAGGAAPDAPAAPESDAAAVPEAGAPEHAGAEADPDRVAPAAADAVADAPRLRFSPTAGEPDDATPAATATDDAELAAMVKPAPNTIARTSPAATEPPVSEAPEPKHG